MDIAHHDEAVPEATTLHQGRGNGAGRFLPEAADATNRIQHRGSQRDSGFDPTIICLGSVGRNAQQDDHLGPRCGRGISRIDMAAESVIV